MSLIRSGKTRRTIQRLTTEGGLEISRNTIRLNLGNGLSIDRDNRLQVDRVATSKHFFFRTLANGSIGTGAVFSVGDGEKRSIRSYPITHDGTIIRVALLTTFNDGNSLKRETGVVRLIINEITSQSFSNQGGSSFIVINKVSLPVTAGQTLGVDLIGNNTNVAYTIIVEQEYVP